MQIPNNERYPGLETDLRCYAELIHNIRKAQPKVSQASPNLFFTLVMPWLVEEPADADGKTRFQNGKVIAHRLGFKGETIAKQLLEILKHDAHLNACFNHPIKLAYFLDNEFIRVAADLFAEGAEANVGSLFATFADKVYGQGRFTRVSYSHIFNLDLEKLTVEFGSFKLQKLQAAEIIALLGEKTETGQSFLQPTGVGSFFLVQEEEGAAGNDGDWFRSRHLAAIELVRVFQYALDGVTHIDYSVPAFRPAWVNEFRRFGLFYFGRPRQFAYQGGKNLVTATDSEMERVRRFLAAYLNPTVVALMKDESSIFRQASLRAGDYFESSLTYERPVERLIALSIALEALFSPGDSHEYSFRISQVAAQLLGGTPAEKKNIYASLRDLYNRRSELMHGTYKVRKVYDGTYVTSDEIDQWSRFIRQGVLRFLAMFLRGKRSDQELRDFRNGLFMAALDPSSADSLRSQSDIDLLIDDLTNGTLKF